MNTVKTEEALNEVFTERVRQELKWGEKNHDLPTYYTILMEEIGEVAQAIVEYKFNPNEIHTIEKIREELIQSAAVAVAMVEMIDRRA